MRDFKASAHSGSGHFWHFMGRHHGGRGAGRFAGGFGDGAGDSHGGFRSGRKLASGDLQLVLLALLAEQPSHGYELIKALDERSGGFYSPSPGMIYPALTYLEEVGHASVELEGNKKRYSVTEQGRAHLETHRATAEAILAQISRVGQKMGRVRRAFSGDAAAETEEEETSAREGAELHQARHALKAALYEKRGSSREEAKRIAAILCQAADAIRGGGS